MGIVMRPRPAQSEAGNAARFGGKLQPARGGETEPAMHLTHHCGQPAMAQPFLHHQKNRSPRLGDDHPVGMQPRRSQSRRKQISPLDYPQHHPLHPRGKACHEQAGGGAMLDLRTRCDNLVQARKRQPGSWQMPINWLNSKWKGDQIMPFLPCPSGERCSFQPRNVLAQRDQVNRGF